MSQQREHIGIEWFRHASPYINAHRGRILVISFGGEALQAPAFASLIHDIALLSHLGIRLVLVPGIRAQIDQRLQAQGIAARYQQGLRITDDASLPSVKEAAGAVRIEMEALLSMGLANTPMSGARLQVTSGNFVAAQPYGIHEGVDFCHTGAIRRVDTAAIHGALDQGQLVMLSPLGYSATGETFNLRGEDVAMQAAIDLHADKLIYLLQNPGVQTDRHLIRQLTPAACDQLIAAADGLDEITATCMQNGARACRHGVPRTHLLGYAADGALITELFTRDGCGTMINSDNYEHIRVATAADLTGILALIAPLQADGTLASRSREQLAATIAQFRVIERDGMIIACAALHTYAEHTGEIACLVVHPDYANAGRAELLCDTIAAQARALGIQQLFVLTTRTAHWFRERGFQPGEIGQLPIKKRQIYNYQRNAKVFIMHLDGDR